MGGVPRALVGRAFGGDGLAREIARHQRSRRLSSYGFLGTLGAGWVGGGGTEEERPRPGGCRQD